MIYISDMYMTPGIDFLNVRAQLSNHREMALKDTNTEKKEKSRYQLCHSHDPQGAVVSTRAFLRFGLPTRLPCQRSIPSQYSVRGGIYRKYFQGNYNIQHRTM